MSTYTEGKIYAFKSSEAIVANKAVIQTADDIVEQCDGAGEQAIGIARTATANAGEALEVVLSGGAKAIAGGTIARGALLKVDANGDLVAASADGDFYVARAMEDAVDNDIFAVELMFGYFYVAA